MRDIQQFRNQPDQKGPLDDLEVVSKLLEGASDQTTTDQTKPTESPSTNTSNAAQRDLTAGSLEVVNETVCRSVSVKVLRQYLLLAGELKHTRERALAEFHSKLLREELGLVDLQGGTTSTATANDSALPSASEPTLVSPKVIARMLELLDISVADWQQVTESASLPALLRAERSLKAMSLGLPKDATEEQIAVKQKARDKELALERDKQAFEQRLKEADLVKQASERIEFLRRNSAHNTSAERDGKVHLHDVEIKVEYWLANSELPQVHETENAVSFRMATGGAILGAVSGAILYGAALFFDAGPFVEGAKHWDGLLIVPFLAMLSTAVAGFFGEDVGSRYHWDHVVPSARQRLAAQLTNSPAMQEVIKELEVRGVKCETSLITYDSGSYLNVHLYAQEQG